MSSYFAATSSLNMFAPRHALRALWHVLKIKKSNIAICKATIPDRFHARYWTLFNAGQVQLELKKHWNEYCEESMALLQNSAVDDLLQRKCGSVVVSGSSFFPSSATSLSQKLAVASTCTTLTSIRGRKPPPFAFSSQRWMETNTSPPVINAIQCTM